MQINISADSPYTYTVSYKYSYGGYTIEQSFNNLSKDRVATVVSDTVEQLMNSNKNQNKEYSSHGNAD